MASALEEAVFAGFYDRAGDASRRATLLSTRAGLPPAVAEKFAEKLENSTQLGNFRAAGTNGGHGKNWDRLEILIKSDPHVAAAMVGQFKADERGYARTLKVLGNNFEANPKFAETMVEKLTAKPETAGAEFASFKKYVDAGAAPSYVQQTLGGPALAPAASKQTAQTAPEPVGTVVSDSSTRTKSHTATTPTAATAQARAAQMKRIQKMAGGAESPAPVSTTSSAAVVAAATGADALASDGDGTISPEAAQKRFAEFGAKPENKEFMSLLQHHKLDKKVEGVLTQHPDQIVTLSDPATLKKMTGQLKEGKTAEFMAEFSGETPKNATNPKEMMAAMMSGLDGLSLQHPTLNKVLNYYKGNVQDAMDLAGRAFGALQGPADNFGDMMRDWGKNNELFAKAQAQGLKVSNPHDEAYLGSLARDAAANLRHRVENPNGDPHVVRNGMDILAKMNVDGSKMQQLMDGTARIDHVNVRQVEKKDSNGRSIKGENGRPEMEYKAFAVVEPLTTRTLATRDTNPVIESNPNNPGAQTFPVRSSASDAGPPTSPVFPTPRPAETIN